MQFRTRESLPIDSFLSKIRTHLHQYSTAIIVAEPGAGKTTHLPPYLAATFGGADGGVVAGGKTNGAWWVVEPRRWAAKESARRIADEQGWRLGEDVGYQVRLENKLTRNTRLVFQTEGIFLKRLLDDPSLDGVAGIILDEFHERSANLDLAAFALKQIISDLRPDLKLLVLSATMDAEKVSKYFSVAGGGAPAPIHNIPGRMFPVDVQYDECAGGMNARPIEWAKKILKHRLRDLDTLVFLPGAGEIERVARDLESLGCEQKILKLYSRLDEREQKIVFDMNRPPAIILSTNIAETSITLPRVGVVVDTGTVKNNRFEPSSGLNKLVLTKISAASAKQRSGRAGRVRAGVAIRLWSKDEQSQKRAFETPEILRTELSQTVLWLKAWGEKDLSRVSWVDAPARARIDEAVLRLQLKGLMDESGGITADGRKVLDWGIDPLVGPLLLEGARLGCLDWTARLAAWMESASRDVRSIEDLERELSALPREAREVAARWSESGGRSGVAAPGADSHLRAMVLALVDRIWINSVFVSGTRLRGSGDSSGADLPACGIAFRIQEDSSGYAKLFSYVALDLKWVRGILADHIHEEVHLEFDAVASRLRAKKASWLGKAPVSAVTEVAVDPLQAGEWFRVNGDRDRLILALVGEDHARWKMFSAAAEGGDSGGRVMSIEEWTDLVWTAATRGKKTVEEISSSLSSHDWISEIPYDQMQLLDREFPSHIEVPSGSRIRLQYDGDRVRCSVRLQEVFGWMTTPRVCFGRVPITIELLSPSYKPVQTTQDLASFWAGAYFEVRKELRARYPKHSWPDDPLTAVPVAKGRRRN